MLCSNAPQEVQREDKQSMEAEAKQSGKNDAIILVVQGKMTSLTWKQQDNSNERTFFFWLLCSIELS